MGKSRRVWFEEAGGMLDPGLISQLRQLRKEGADEQKTGLPVIVRWKDRTDRKEREEALRICEGGSCDSVFGELSMSASFYGQLSPGTIDSLKDHKAVSKIYFDREVQALLDVASKSVGAVDVREHEGLSGKGVTIAVLDTGIHPHDDLTKPEERISGFADLVGEKQDPYDDQGHGTHCAGDAAGNGHLSEGLYTGPASEANVVGVKVLDKEGGGRLSTVIRGVEWCIQHREELDIRVISLSLGAPAFESYRDDPLAQACEAAWHSGIVVCAAAGNQGPYPGTISTPGIDPVIITVGSADDQDTIERGDDEKAPYSSRGPTLDLLVKPDIYAPGTNIISLSVPDSPLEEELPENRVGDYYISLSGTSMATPVCAGVVALMLEANPRLSPNDVKSILKSTAAEMEGDQAGYIDSRRAVDLAKKYLQFQQPFAPVKG
ncbi:S8 family peptidase [Paludifilum halophilum]|uniref:Serine protease n=1 Tax=Paludifilum halophilum TaxID=1642702 RepID=A0A235B404_9BACL|nr:S8 family peptidase [Paludifilum halophilum]OYD07003.1 serine protease [Paludifilum halophilum]